MKNREIKFRAWNRITKLMTSSFGIYDLVEHKTFISGTILQEFDNLIFMQFTGLLDKNGREIYEGDIVKGDVFEGMKRTEWIGYVWYRCLDFVARQDLSADKYNYTYKEFNSGFEVIGNVYENPDLLK